MKRLLMVSLSTICFSCNIYADSTLSDLAATVLFPSFAKWAKEMREKVYTTFDMIVPESEKANWKKQKDADWDGAELGDVNEYVTGRWIPVNDDPERWTERVLIDYRNTKNTLGRTFSSIDEFVALYKETVRSVWRYDKSWNINKISENEVIIEYLVEDQQTKKIIARTLERCVLFNEWLISTTYEIRPSRNPEKESKWSQNSQTWSSRFSKFQFN